MRSRVRVWAAGAAVLGVLAVSACDPGEDPTDPPTTSAESTTSGEPTTSESPSEVATPPEVEAPTPAPEASVDDHVGAIYAARYFLDLYTYMRATGDTSQFEAMSRDGCKFCASSIANAEEIHDGGGWVEGGEIEFDLDRATADYPTTEEPNYVVRFRVEQAPQVVLYEDGNSEEIEGVSLDFAVAMRFVDGRFTVSGVNFE